jgi:hypothetical protein
MRFNVEVILYCKQRITRNVHSILTVKPQERGQRRGVIKTFI